MKQTLRRCPKCNRITERFSCCLIKGPALFPDAPDTYANTEPCAVIAVDDLKRWIDRRSVTRESGIQWINADDLIEDIDKED